MPTNLELKIKITDRKKLMLNLRKIKAKYTATLKQKDIYYKNKSGLLKLRVQGKENQLIHYVRDERGRRYSNYEILELKGDNPENYLAGILNVEVVVKKERKLYMYKNTRIHVDKVEGLGDFIEFETLVGKSKLDARKEFNNLVELLEINIDEQIRKSYRNLVARK